MSEQFTVKDFKKPLWKWFWIGIGASFLLAFIIWLLTPLLSRFPHLPDQGPSWYYWKLPEADFWARMTSWGGYLLHQLVVWTLIFKAKKKPPENPFKWNFLVFGVNLLFILLHLGQTHLFYDGLAQDVTVWSSQYSVIGMLIIVLLLMVPRRGIFWGKKFKLPTRELKFLKKNHGFYISWALVYTFWFHPMDGDLRLIIGFLYMFFLFIQMSLMGTPIHFNSKWIIFLEFFVTIHGTIVAILSNQPMWTMFLFGFLFMFVFTQMHGLKMASWLKWVCLGSYIAGAGVAYYFRGFERLYELSFIPGTLYAGAGLLALLIRTGLKVKTILTKKQ